MRYMIVTYIGRARARGAGLQQDEVVAVARRLRDRDLDTASVILDFATHTVTKSSVGDQQAPKDWSRIRDYYYQHYGDLIDQLESAQIKQADQSL